MTADIALIQRSSSIRDILKRTCVMRFILLQTLSLDDPSKDSAVPGLDRFEAHNKPVLDIAREIQKAIADFLDRETARIDQLIEKKQRLIALLGERYGTSASGAVSGRAGYADSMRDSGIHWIGAIPA